MTGSGSRALGIAQFMPRTANERGLLDPFDPVQALPKSAEFYASSPCNLAISGSPQRPITLGRHASSGGSTGGPAAAGDAALCPGHHRPSRRRMGRRYDEAAPERTGDRTN